VGQKVHPIGFRLGIIRDWDAKWYAERNYTELLQEDLQIRKIINDKFTDAGISTIEIDRSGTQTSVTVHTSRPGIVIGRSGSRVDELRRELEKAIGRRLRLNIQEIRQPELDAYLVARSLADSLERRVSYRRAIKEAISRTMQRGAEGIKITVAGRLGGAEIARKETEKAGRVPLHTLRADIDYGQAEAHTTFGRIGVKVWIYRGDVLPAPRYSEEVMAPSLPPTLPLEDRAPTPDVVDEVEDGPPEEGARDEDQAPEE